MVYFNNCRIREFEILESDIENSIIKISISEVVVEGVAEDVFQIMPGEDGHISVVLDQKLGVWGYEEFNKDNITEIGIYYEDAKIDVLELVDAESVSDNQVRSTLICEFTDYLEFYQISNDDPYIGSFK